jgi:Tfp pilus assembly protein FimT
MNILGTLALISILSVVAVGDIKQVGSPANDAAFQVNHFLRLARARAMSQTEFIQVAPVNDSSLQASSSDSCFGTMSTISDLTLSLPNDSAFSDTGWSVCFTPRGLAASNVSFMLYGEGYSHYRTVEVALGGGVKVSGEGY